MLALAGTDREHEIVPVPGSARQLDGSPADLTRPMDYPCEALCTQCGRPARYERWFRGAWVHIEAFTMHGGQD